MTGDLADRRTAAFEFAQGRRYNEALAICDNILLNNPSNAMGHYMKSIVTRMMGERDVARKCLNRAVELEPHTLLFFMRAHVEIGDKRYEVALKDLDRAAKADEEQEFAPAIALLRADCYLGLGDLDAARRECEHIPDDFEFPAYKATSREGVLAKIRQMGGG